MKVTFKNSSIIFEKTKDASTVALNVCNQSTATGNIGLITDPSSSTRLGIIEYMPIDKRYIKVTFTVSTGVSMYIYFYDENKNFVALESPDIYTQSGTILTGNVISDILNVNESFNNNGTSVDKSTVQSTSKYWRIVFGIPSTPATGNYFIVR